MKKINFIYLGLAISVFLFSCGESNPMKKMQEAKDGVGAVSELLSASAGALKDMKDLSELEPWTHQDFENWKPGETFQGLERTRLQIGGSLAESSIEMDYGTPNNTDGKRLEINIIDGADNQGGQMMVIQARMLLNSDMLQKNIQENDQQRIVDKHGQRAIESVRGPGEQAIETLVNDRFYVRIAGYNMEMDEVWNAFRALGTDRLK